jgi:hypothetical protein
MYVSTCRMCHGAGAKPCACYGSGKVWRREGVPDAVAPALATDELDDRSDLSGAELWDRVKAAPVEVEGA